MEAGGIQGYVVEAGKAGKIGEASENWQPGVVYIMFIFACRKCLSVHSGSHTRFQGRHPTQIWYSLATFLSSAGLHLRTY